MDDFSKVPRTLGEARSEKTQDGADWSPRDALIHLLRKIDSGEVQVKELVISYRGEEDGHVLNASADIWSALGLLEAAKLDVWGGRSA